ncbi:site-specific integrase [Photobacterium sp. SDRW27]|uniref:site-specific integrase n=1 Tax=Photobacterium obscurum TaxID=2829490 RepID=UPI002243D767|nr:site-specific integrase [Photobacterium obscurum]MCW8328749.1 site-specific integrase [Photobacterium obscurum]
MYLFRAANCTYYTRICLPKSLKDRGFPFDIKVSLLTKCRAEAVERNLEVARTLRPLVAGVRPDETVADFKRLVDQTINQIRIGFTSPDKTTVPIRIASKASDVEASKPPPGITLSEALSQFIASKEKESVRPLTVKQLKQRIEHFITSTKATTVFQVTSAEALVYRDVLLGEGRSHKTNKEYLSAVSQFFKWCKLMCYTTVNPFTGIPMAKSSSTGDGSARKRWQKHELKRLFQSAEFKAKDAAFKWVTLLMLFHGLRPSEACQLRVEDICDQDGMTCIRVSSEGGEQRVKTDSSYRLVPVHTKILSWGFQDYVSELKQAGQTQLFSYIPLGENKDWSRQYCQQLARLQNKIGMKAGQRPTAYSFRHTFVDELKQQEVDENIVAQLVGHKNQKITFGRYGKKYKLSVLKKYLELINYGADCTVDF